MPDRSLSRRRILKASLALAATYTVDVGAARRFRADGVRDKSAGAVAEGRIAPLLGGAKELLKTIENTPSGLLMRSYQLFVPLQLEAIAEGLTPLALLDELAELSESVEETRPLRHRIKALPALAAIHGLADASQEESQEIDARIRAMHARGTEADKDLGSPRDVLQMLWQNLTAALIRNDSSWANLRVSDPLLQQALELVDDYGLGREPMVLQASLCAWQFLTTYRNALGTHPQARWLRDVMHEREVNPEPRFAWFAALSRLLGTSTQRAGNRPQLSEALMAGLGGIAPDPLRDLVTLSKLLDHGLYQGIASGVSHSKYTNAERAREGLAQNLTFLANYGVTPSDRERLIDQVRLLALPSETVQSVKHALSEFSQYVGTTDREARESDLAEAKRLARGVPFWQSDGELTLEGLAARDRSFIADCETAVREQAPDKFTRLLLKPALLAVSAPTDKVESEIRADEVFQRFAKPSQPVWQRLLEASNSAGFQQPARSGSALKVAQATIAPSVIPQPPASPPVKSAEGTSPQLERDTTDDARAGEVLNDSASLQERERLRPMTTADDGISTKRSALVRSFSAILPEAALLKDFAEVFEFRRNFEWLPESASQIERALSDAIGEALVRHVPPSEFDRLSETTVAWDGTAFRALFLAAVEALPDPLVQRLFRRLARLGISPESESLRGAAFAAMHEYVQRRHSGTSGDPW